MVMNEWVKRGRGQPSRREVGIGKGRWGPVVILVSQGKGHCGVREDSDCSTEVCLDPVVGTDGVIEGQDQREILGRHMDYFRDRGGRRRGG